jgi:hypothetical protein
MTFALVALCNTETTYYYNDVLSYAADGLTTVMAEAQPHSIIVAPYELGIRFTARRLGSTEKARQRQLIRRTLSNQASNMLVEAGIKLNSGYAM